MTLFWVASLDSITSTKWSNYVYSWARQLKVGPVNAVPCHTVSHCDNFFLSSVAPVNNIMYWEHTSCLCFPCKLHRKACWHCPSQLITVEIKALSQWKEEKSLSGGGMEGWCTCFFCVFMSIIQRCRGSIGCESLLSSWQLIILYITPSTLSEETVINYPHLSLWSSLRHSWRNRINFSHIRDPAVLSAPR